MNYICNINCSYRTPSGYCGVTGGYETCQYRQIRKVYGICSFDSNAMKSDADHIPVVLVYESHGQDCRYKPLGEVCSTISQKYGTGGGNAPIVVEYENVHREEIF